MEIRQITEQNPWWEDKDRINEDEKVKESVARIHKIENTFGEENELMIGPRQVGKTTFIKLYIKNLIEKGVDPKRTLYFSCEVLKDFNDILEIIRFSDTLTTGKKYLFFEFVRISLISSFIPKHIFYILINLFRLEKSFFIINFF